MNIIVVCSDYTILPKDNEKALKKFIRKYNKFNGTKQQIFIMKFNHGNFMSAISKFNQKMDMYVYLTNNIYEFTIMSNVLKQPFPSALVTDNLNSEYISKCLDFVQDIIYLKNTPQEILARIITSYSNQMKQLRRYEGMCYGT